MTTTQIAPPQALDTASGGSRQLVCFAIGTQDLGVPIARVQETIRYTPPRPIPGSAEAETVGGTADGLEEQAT